MFHIENPKNPTILWFVYKPVCDNCFKLLQRTNKFRLFVTENLTSSDFLLKNPNSSDFCKRESEQFGFFVKGNPNSSDFWYKVFEQFTVVISWSIYRSCDTKIRTVRKNLT